MLTSIMGAPPHRNSTGSAVARITMICVSHTALLCREPSLRIFISVTLTGCFDRTGLCRCDPSAPTRQPFAELVPRSKNELAVAGIGQHQKRDVARVGEAGRNILRRARDVVVAQAQEDR